MTKYSKEVLREFYDREQINNKPDYMLQPPMTIPGAGATGGTLRPGRSIGALIGAGIGALGGLLTRNKPVAGFIQPGTGGPNRGGRGPRTPNTGGGSGSEPIRNLGFLAKTVRYLGDKILGVGVIIGGIWIGFKLFVKESKVAIGNLIDSLPLSDEHKEWLKANMLLVVMSVGLLVGSAEAARRITPRIMKVLRNRRISAEIGEALDAGDETMARTILLDAIEDENINLSAIRRRLGDDDYERLYRDFL